LPPPTFAAQANSFRGFKAIGIFLFFGAAMASLSGAALIWRRTDLAPIFFVRLWVWNAQGYHRPAPLGNAVGVAFFMLGAVLLIAGRGWFLRRFWDGA